MSHNKYPMKQYTVYAHSPSKGLKLALDHMPFTDDTVAASEAAKFAAAFRLSNHLDTQDWEAWVRIEPVV